MASRYCDACGIYYPPTEMKCLVCKEPNTYTGQWHADSDWRTKVGDARDNAGVLPAVDWGHIVRSGDAFWIADDHLKHAGYNDRKIGMIFRVVGLVDNAIFMEIDGRAVRLAGQPLDTPTIRGWWVNRVMTEDWVPDAPPLP